MNKIQILQQLHGTANQLEKKGLYAEANVLTNVMTRVAQQAPQQPVNMQQQPGQQAGRRRTEQEEEKLNQLFKEREDYDNRFTLLAQEVVRKEKAGIMLQETNNMPTSVIDLQKILDYRINLNNQINALLTIDGIDASEQNFMNSSKQVNDSHKQVIYEITQYYQRLKSTGKRIPQQPQ